MQESHQDGRRIRNVPIRIEGDMNGASRYNTEPRRGHREQNYGEYEPDNYQRQAYPHANLNEPNQSNRRTSPHTSSINIHYKPQPSSYREQRQQECNDQDSAHNVGSEEPIRRAENSSRLNARQQQRHQEHETEGHGSPDKENSFKSSNDYAMHETDDGKSDERKPSPIPPVIPLPPPPSHAKPAKDGQTDKEGLSQEQNQQSHQDLEEKDKAKKVKQQDTGPLSVINATKAEVNRLLQEVIKCDETSTKSKKFLHLEEMLTLCILKLDSIEAGPELRQQRKEVINMINKCTDILERKVNLNNDIQQLAANCQQ